MNKIKWFKYCILIYFIYYCSNEIVRSNYYYRNHFDFIMMILFFSLILIYWLMKPLSKMSLKRANKLKDDIALEYDIHYDKTTNSMTHMYVRECSLNGIFWYELDYAYTISQGSSLHKAQFFSEKFNTSEKLKGWMNKKAIQEKNQDIASQNNIEYWLMFIAMLTFFGIYSMVMWVYELEFIY